MTMGSIVSIARLCIARVSIARAKHGGVTSTSTAYKGAGVSHHVCAAVCVPPCLPARGRPLCLYVDAFMSMPFGHWQACAGDALEVETHSRTCFDQWRSCHSTVLNSGIGKLNSGIGKLFLEH